MKQGAAPRRRPDSWLLARLSIGFVIFAELGASSCAPVEQLVVGDLTGQGGGGPGSSCQAAGAPCSAGADCCAQVCDLASGRCGQGIAACRGAGEDCVTALDCCGLGCVEGACLATCVSDDDLCQLDAECCSGSCAEGACVALSGRCLTAGNACLSSSECCSGLCDAAGRCSLASSYCAQPYDVCRAGSDCCTGICDIAVGASLGSCGQTPSGASNCAAGVSGLLCDDCNQCCSRLCEPYADSGVSICMPPSGCRVTGEICEEDADCCGGNAESGLPGAGNGACDKTDGAPVGVCRNAMGCAPLGNVCHLMDYTCSVSAASNRCCDGSSPGVCALDALGIPRCGLEGAVCKDPGEACASSAECCDGRPCTVDSAGAFRCRAELCAPVGASCSGAADCCAGLSCSATAGSAAGECYLAEAQSE